MQGAMETCPFKTVISGGMGFALGGAFGLFMSSVCTSPKKSLTSDRLDQRYPVFR